MNCYVLSDVKGGIIPVLETPLREISDSYLGACRRNLSSERDYITFEIPEEYSDGFIGNLKEVLTKKVIYSAKKDYFLTNIPFKKDNLYAFILRQALIFADFEFNCKILDNTISGFSKFFLDGIENFLLKREKEEWNELCDATRENAFKLTRKKEFKKYLRCITSSIQTKADSLYLLGDDKAYLVTEDLKKVGYSFSEFETLSDDYSLIATLIEFFPKKLVIYTKNLSADVLEALDLLFDNSETF